MKVTDLMVHDVVTCTDASKLDEVVKLFWEKNIGFLPVLSAETGRLCGVVTDRDAAIAAYFVGKPLSQIRVRQAMSSRVVTVRPEAVIDQAEELMIEHQLHRLPVVTPEGSLAGVISLSDIAQKAVSDEHAGLEEEVALTLGAVTRQRETADIAG
jgi:CBS domain-containing protein